jgi:hypothetical protein
MIPFTFYILAHYKTDFKKSNKEGHFSSFNEKMPLPFVEDVEEEEGKNQDRIFEEDKDQNSTGMEEEKRN